MVQSIELLFDAETEAALRRSWDVLAEAELPSLANHVSETNRPHVTVAAAEEGLGAAEDAVRAVARGWDLDGAGLSVTVGSPMLFGGHKQRWVLVRQVVMSRPLLVLHAAVHRALAEHAPDAEVDEQTRPDGWTPHVSLARRITSDRVGEALDLLDVKPLAGRLAGLRLWDSPSKTVTAL